jgi:hypothetical protein
LIWLLAVLLLGALAASGTLLHTLAVMLDVLGQSIGWNSATGITISSRAGLAARAGRPFWARAIGLLFFDPQHCEEAIAADIERAREALSILTGRHTQ